MVEDNLVVPIYNHTVSTVFSAVDRISDLGFEIFNFGHYGVPFRSFHFDKIKRFKKKKLNIYIKKK